MCGIGGVLSFNGRPDPDVGAAMTDCMFHRGPHDKGIHADGPILLAHRRLSILDLSDAGHQPMSNRDGSVWIVFNGEIYNFQELKDDLTGHSFRSNTDTEVLLHMYDEYGTDCLSRLRGMFAFAIWDDEAEQLFLARDRTGQKPLFYYHDENGMRFGSTIKTILSDPRVPARADEAAIWSFLQYHYVPSPDTGFKGVQRLEPGEYMIVSEDSIRKESYWNLSFQTQSNATPEKLMDRLRNRLREATRLRMRSDVPVGVFLSGGIDSTITTGLMSDLTDDPVKTYSVGFEQESHNELEFANLVADAYDTDHHEYTVSPDAVELLPEIIEHYEMPFGDTSVIPTYYVSEKAGQDIRVALTGDAGDENFAGYTRYTYDQICSIVSRVPSPLRRAARAVLAGMDEVVDGPEQVHYARRMVEIADADPDVRYAHFVTHLFDESFQDVWAGEQQADKLAWFRSHYDQTDGPERLDRVLQFDIRTYLPDDLLVKIDRATMAHSLEARSPFLDHTVLELCARIPAKYKWRRGEKKWILKRAFEDLVPDPVIKREKQGFGVPVHQWFRSGLREHGREMVERHGQREVFNSAVLETLFAEHVNDGVDNGHHLWDLLILDRWYRRYIDDR
ncbi:asparagine synthase (glutamine-hydrolyzing) [Halosimplex amylolyticum]|uniref:asparagine synthase (glutamine-hydrolyzing) n=1 Tax=Halosimplex amylolyticum TaxID=3396616 RepID=UPI003F559E4F